MIGAVLWTFAATILLFLLGYILLHVRHRKNYPNIQDPKTFNSLTLGSTFLNISDFQVPDIHFSRSPEVTGNPSRGRISKTKCLDPGRWFESRSDSGVVCEYSTYDLPFNHMEPLRFVSWPNVSSSSMPKGQHSVKCLLANEWMETDKFLIC